jgi:hypothetical protein
MVNFSFMNRPFMFSAFPISTLCMAMQAFDLLDVAPPPIPTITLSLRHRTPEVRMCG